MSFRRSKRKFLVVLTLLLTLVSQALAATAAACPMMDKTPDQTMAMDNHGVDCGHGLNDAESSSTPDENCCLSDNSCPMSSCVSAGIMASASVTASALVASEKIQFSDHAFTSAAITSLYRPPISR